MTPRNNCLLVAIKERFTTTATPGKAQLILPAGSDDWQTLTEQLKTGQAVNIETADDIVKTPVRQGLVVGVPMQLTQEMTLCTAPGTYYSDRKVVVLDKNQQPVKDVHGLPLLKNEGYTEMQHMRTCADINEPVEVGQEIHFDPAGLTDEVAPGVYLVPYWAVICVILEHEPFYLYSKRIKKDFSSPIQFPTILLPIAGYVLLNRVWADDVQEAEVEGRLIKVRYSTSGLVAETDVPALNSEGIVAWVGRPLRGTSDKLAVGDRVVFHGYKPFADKSQPLDTGPAIVETIAGTEYLCVRQDQILAVRTTQAIFATHKGNIA